jgi:amphi-Trp domain-containing protein
MKHNKRSFRHESLKDKESISQILNAITEAIANGKLVFSDEDDKITMEPEGLLELKVKASQEEGLQRVNIRISWQVETRNKNSKKQLTVSS